MWPSVGSFGGYVGPCRPVEACGDNCSGAFRRPVCRVSTLNPKTLFWPIYKVGLPTCTLQTKCETEGISQGVAHRRSWRTVYHSNSSRRPCTHSTYSCTRQMKRLRGDKTLDTLEDTPSANISAKTSDNTSALK